MGVIFKLALNNLLQHKSKSIIIGLFIAIGMVIIQLGNGFLESANRGMERDFRANFTGDIVVSTTIPKGVYMDIVGITDMSNVIETKSVLPFVDIENAAKVIAETDGIKKTSRFVTAQGVLMNSDMADFQVEDQDTSKLPAMNMFGGESPNYFELFPDLKLLEGRMPAAGTNEIIVLKQLRENFQEYYKEPLELNRTIYISGTTSSTTIREAKIVGFFDFASEHSAMTSVVYADPTLIRSFAGLTYGANFTQELPENINAAIGSYSEEELFGSDDMDLFEENSEDFEIINKSGVDFDSILGDTTLRDKLNETDDGAWHYILIKTNKQKDADKIIEKLNDAFGKQEINAVARNWKWGAGTFTSATQSISVIFTVLVVILAIVVFIIIMNTMVISVIERTGEIGTMRAIGAEKSFVRKLFFCESVTLTLISEIAGSIITLILMGILNLCNFTVDGMAAKILLSGGAIGFVPTFGNFIGTMIIIMIGTILANLYPVSSALKITPLKALSKSDS